MAAFFIVTFIAAPVKAREHPSDSSYFNIEKTTLNSLAHKYIIPAVLFLSFVGNSAVGHAQHFFNFVEDGTGDIMAVLELSSLPLDHESDVVGLAITDAGNDLFQFTTVDYLDFSQTPGMYDVADIVGGELRSIGTGADRAGISDLTRIESTARDGPFGIGGPNHPSWFSMRFSAESGSQGSQLVFNDDRAGVSTEGRFVSTVPEPSSALMGLTAVLLVAGRRRFRRSNA